MWTLTLEELLGVGFDSELLWSLFMGVDGSWELGVGSWNGCCGFC